MACRSMVCIYFSVHASFYRQGLSLVCRCSQRWAAWLPAAETPLLQGRPGCRNHSAIGPAAMVAWYGDTNRSHSKGNGPNLDLTQSQPRTPREVLRGGRPKRVLVSFARSKETPSGKRPHQAGKPDTKKREGRTFLSLFPVRRQKKRAVRGSHSTFSISMSYR